MAHTSMCPYTTCRIPLVTYTPHLIPPSPVGWFDDEDERDTAA